MRWTGFGVSMVEITPLFKLFEDMSDSRVVNLNGLSNFLQRQSTSILFDDMGNFHGQCIDHNVNDES
jgi:hypothetical protein